MELLCRVWSHIETFLLLSVLVKQDEIRIVPWDEVHLQGLICISVARLLYEALNLRKLVQSSSRTCLNLCSPDLLLTRCNDAWPGAAFGCNKPLLQECEEIIGLPAVDLDGHDMVGVLEV